MQKILTVLEGKKTYIVAAVLALLNLAAALGWITPAHLAAINTVLAALGLAAIRAAV